MLHNKLFPQSPDTGNMSPQARRDALKEIQTDENCTVIIISIKAGGVGLNILACNSVILMDPWWNPYFEEQAIARVHRIGQKKDVEIYHLIVKNSLEEHIMETQKKKRQMIEGGRSDVKFEPKAELDAETMRSWLCETKAEQD
uniref:Helicase C-terminal domain-containing protein n=1 Tax=Psilocybe cubensis TaxID=181762 RepID=A0A8H8CS39_PSICU